MCDGLLRRQAQPQQLPGRPARGLSPRPEFHLREAKGRN